MSELNETEYDNDKRYDTSYSEYNSDVKEQSFIESPSYNEFGESAPKPRSSPKAFKPTPAVMMAVAAVALVTVIAPVFIGDVTVESFEIDVGADYVTYSFQFSGLSDDTELDISLHNYTFDRSIKVSTDSVTHTENGLYPGLQYTLTVTNGISTVFETSVTTANAGYRVENAYVEMTSYSTYLSYEYVFKGQDIDVNDCRTNYRLLIESPPLRSASNDWISYDFVGSPSDEQRIEIMLQSYVLINAKYQVVCLENNNEIIVAEGRFSPIVDYSIDANPMERKVTVGIEVNDYNEMIGEMAFCFYIPGAQEILVPITEWHGTQVIPFPDELEDMAPVNVYIRCTLQGGISSIIGYTAVEPYAYASMFIDSSEDIFYSASVYLTYSDSSSFDAFLFHAYDNVTKQSSTVELQKTENMQTVDLSQYYDDYAPISMDFSISCVIGDIEYIICEEHSQPYVLQTVEYDEENKTFYIDTFTIDDFGVIDGYDLTFYYNGNIVESMGITPEDREYDCSDYYDIIDYWETTCRIANTEYILNSGTVG